MVIFASSKDVQIEGKHGTVFTYEVTGATETLARKRAKANATVRFPMKIGASKVISSTETGNGAISGYEVDVFVLSEDLFDKLGLERAIDGLQELGIIEVK